MWFENYEWIFLGCIIIISSSFLFFFKRRKKRNIPPGPPGRFLIGNTFLFKPRPHDKLNELSKQYGPIYQFYFFGQPIIVLSDYEIIKEAFVRQGDAFSGRPKHHVAKTYSSRSGIVFNQGESLFKLKKFALQVFRRFGLGKGSLEERIQKEVELLCKIIKDKNSQPFNMRSLLMQTASNIIQSIVFSSPVDFHGVRNDLLTAFDELFTGFVVTNPVNFFPPLGYVLKKFKKFKHCVKLLRAMMNSFIKKHEETFDSENIRDYIDAYLLKQQENKDLNINDPSFTRLNLLVTLTDFFLGGIDTITHTLLWAIIYLMHHPEIQEAVHKEIDSVLEPNELPKMSHKKDLPFTTATILEVQRYSNAVPLSLAHCTTDNANLCGYDIPKGVCIISNLTAVHFDPKYWHDPHKFDPSRFLNDSREIRKNIDSFMPFGIGPRTCLGEVLAKTELFLLFSTLLKCFEFKPLPEEGLPSMTEVIDGSVLRPLPYKCCAIPRHTLTD